MKNQRSRSFSAIERLVLTAIAIVIIILLTWFVVIKVQGLILRAKVEQIINDENRTEQQQMEIMSELRRLEDKLEQDNKERQKRIEKQEEDLKNIRNKVIPDT